MSMKSITSFHLLLMSVCIGLVHGTHLVAFGGAQQNELPIQRRHARSAGSIMDTIKISSLQIKSSTTARFTNTSITTQLLNTADDSKETELVMALPDETFITELLIEVNGIVYRSDVKEKEEAQEIYDRAKDCGRTASIVKQRSERTFFVSINVAPTSDVKCTLIYQQLLLRKKGFYENRISIRPNQTVPDLTVEAYIIEPEGLTTVKAWLETSKDNKIVSTDLATDNIDTTAPTRAQIQYRPSEVDQLAQSPQGITSDLVIQYDVNHEFNAGNIQVVNGYFVHHFSPEGIAPITKNVIFVIDISGSMEGLKLDQTRDAMLIILDQLRESDTFNIVLFHTTVSQWKDGIVHVTSNTIENAKKFVQGLKSKESTNFYGGIQKAVSLLDKYHSSTNNMYKDKTLSMIIILSDGQPTAGTSDTSEIVKLTKQDINDLYSLFTIGFGDYVDNDFLTKLAGQNKGTYRKISVDSDSSLQLTGFFDDVSTPLFINIQFEYAPNVVIADSITQTSFPSYFQGSELVVAGQLSQGYDEITANVTGATSDQGVIDITTTGSVRLSENIALNPNAVEDFAQRLWAYFTIKELLRKQIITDDKDLKERLERQALNYSLKYHFVTPLTSLVVVKPEEEMAENNQTFGECGSRFKSRDFDFFRTRANPPRRPAIQTSGIKTSTYSPGGSAAKQQSYVSLLVLLHGIFFILCRID